MWVTFCTDHGRITEQLQTMEFDSISDEYFINGHVVSQKDYNNVYGALKAYTVTSLGST